MEGNYVLVTCSIILLDLILIAARSHEAKMTQAEGQVVARNGSQGPSTENNASGTESSMPADWCRGYFDVMGQWDPPFHCNSDIYLYCCGTCGYRFCCKFKHDRLDQSTCSNYDTPNWASTGRPPARVDDTPEDPTKDKTNMIVYIICGVVAVMVLVGIFTKLGLEKSQGPQTEMNMSRTLTDLLKQPGHGAVDHISDGALQIQLGDGLLARSTRSSIDHTHLNNAGVTSPILPQTGMPHSHSNIAQLTPTLSLQAPEYTKYSTLKAVAETVTDEYYKRFPVMDMPAPGTPNFKSISGHPKDTPLPDGCTLEVTTPIQKTKVMKTNTHHFANSGYKGWDTAVPTARRQAYTNKRQFSIEQLPELFSQPLHYNQPQRHFSTNSKTEVTV
ncbi:protein shisa-8 [Protopterus annectens]|uniref:protein shisa-8 n=1 Tax=Protopterus annectens TaxID=7888 RepID=UPI001CF9CB5C|nr:protein shisa-8 [Protopterus annectens]